MRRDNVEIKRYLERQWCAGRGLLAAEWAMVAYLLLTLVVIACQWQRLESPMALIAGRGGMLLLTLAAWALYRRYPCRLMHLARIVLLIVTLSWWYPDTYELNRMLTNQDPFFAGLDQQLFGFQPALLFSQGMPQAWFSELMYLGYSSYYPLLVVVSAYYFFYSYERFDRVAFVMIASFFVYYVIFIFLPVTGPQYYYQAVGVDAIAAGQFPPVGDWFATHQESLPLPGWTHGVCYWLVEFAHAAGERPTAAFPSSHVGVTTILMILAWKSGSRRLLLGVTPLYVLMIFATVYIQAHYAVDAIAGLVTGVIIYGVLDLWAKKMELR